jgi:hypothetical protein
MARGRLSTVYRRPHVLANVATKNSLGAGLPTPPNQRICKRKATENRWSVLFDGAHPKNYESIRVSMQSRSPLSKRLFVSVAALLLVHSLSHSIQAADLSGAWSGYWQSESTGHRGPLRCTLTRLDNGAYRADFSGRFFKVLPFRYSVDLDVIQDGDTVILSGQHRLGRRLGDFYYHAEATGDEFVANYSSCKDQGQFVLTRCCCATSAK